MNEVEFPFLPDGGLGKTNGEVCNGLRMSKNNCKSSAFKSIHSELEHFVCQLTI